MYASILCAVGNIKHTLRRRSKFNTKTTYLMELMEIGDIGGGVWGVIVLK